MNRWISGFVLALAAAGVARPSTRGDAPRTPTTSTIRGRVVELGELAKRLRIQFDREPTGRQVVLEEDDGTITPLLPDDASRALFLDARLRGRRAELVARRHKGLPYLQVVSFKVEDEARMRAPEYFCEICSISVRFPQVCPCCQGSMILRMRDDAP